MQEDNFATKSKTDLSREAREERLAKENKNGKKAPLQLKKSGSYVAMAVVAVVLVVVLLFGSVSFGLAQKYLPAAKVGSHTVSVAEYNFFYNSIASQIANYARRLGQTVNLNEQAPFAEKKGQTWGEMIEDVTQKQLQNFAVAYEEAMKKGVKLDDKEQKELDQMIADYKQKLQANKTTLAETLVSNYGKGVSEALFRDIIRRQTIVEKYKKQAPQDIKYSDADLEKLYQAKKDEYDVYDFLFANLVVKPDSVEKPKMPDKSKEKDKEKLKKINEESAKLQKEYKAKVEKANKAANAKAKAIQEEAKQSIKDASSFKAFVDKYKNLYQTENGMRQIAPYRYKRLKAMVTDQGLAKFLSESKRKANDLYAVNKENTTIVNLGMYLNRQRDESATIHAAVRVVQKNAILQQYNKLNKDKKDKQDKKLSEADTKAAQELANKALQDYLAKNNSLEAMKNTEVKDYQSSFMDMVDFVPSTSPFVNEMGEWLEDKTRKQGDTNIFNDEKFGLYAVTFLERLPKAAWQSTVNYKESRAQFEKDFADLLKKPENKVSYSFANRLVDRAPFLKAVPRPQAQQQTQAQQQPKQQAAPKKTEPAKPVASATKASK